MVFTQFTDTMDRLSRSARELDLKIMCFSGRGGEVCPKTAHGAGSRATRSSAGSAKDRRTCSCARTRQRKAGIFSSAGR